MASKSQAIAITKANLHGIFGERDPEKRLFVIANLWVPSSSVLFVDPMGVFKSHTAISGMVDKILAMGGPKDIFSELSDVECLRKDEEDDLWVTRVKWGVGAPGKEYAMSGCDIVTIIGGKIKSCYTFVDGKP